MEEIEFSRWLFEGRLRQCKNMLPDGRAVLAVLFCRQTFSGISILQKLTVVGNLIIYCNVVKNSLMCSNVYSKKNQNIHFTMKEEILTFFNFISIPLCIGIKLSLSLKIGLRLNTSVSYFKVGWQVKSTESEDNKKIALSTEE